MRRRCGTLIIHWRHPSRQRTCLRDTSQHAVPFVLAPFVRLQTAPGPRSSALLLVRALPHLQRCDSVGPNAFARRLQRRDSVHQFSLAVIRLRRLLPHGCRQKMKRIAGRQRAAVWSALVACCLLRLAAGVAPPTLVNITSAGASWETGTITVAWTPPSPQPSGWVLHGNRASNRWYRARRVADPVGPRRALGLQIRSHCSPAGRHK